MLVLDFLLGFVLSSHSLGVVISLLWWLANQWCNNNGDDCDDGDCDEDDDGDDGDVDGNDDDDGDYNCEVLFWTVVLL